jgi:hypothetical protein
MTVKPRLIIHERYPKDKFLRATLVTVDGRCWQVHYDKSKSFKVKNRRDAPLLMDHGDVLVVRFKTNVELIHANGASLVFCEEFDDVVHVAQLEVILL